MAAALVAGALRRGRAGVSSAAERTLRRLVSTLVVAEHEGGLVTPSSLSALAAAEAIAKENKVSLLLGGSGPTLHKAAEHAASSHPLVNEFREGEEKLARKEADVFVHQSALLRCRFLSWTRTYTSIFDVVRKECASAAEA